MFSYVRGKQKCALGATGEIQWHCEPLGWTSRNAKRKANVTEIQSGASIKVPMW